VSRLVFLSPHEADVPTTALGKLEVRGGVPEGAIPTGPARALVVVEGDPRPERDRLTAAGYRVYDMTAALVTIEVEGEQLMRRLTELDLEALPAIGAVARGTTAVVERLGPDRFRLHVAQELSQYVADVVDDLAKGLPG
jgi:sarcosine oxidase gamma subunit